MTTIKIYGEVDHRDVPQYSVDEVGRHLHLSSSTVSAWFRGRAYSTAAGARQTRNVLRPAQENPCRLSFHNLIEAHMLRAFRNSYGSSLQQIRDAIDYAESNLEIDRLLLRKDLQAAAGDVFLERFGELLNLSKAGQISMRQVWQQHLERVEFAPDNKPGRLFPWLFDGPLNRDSRSIVIDPHIAFGSPVIASRSISTKMVVMRLNAGQSVSSIATDFGISESEVTDAAVFEVAA